ncbi:MAG: hypothetical protein IJG24_08470 [Selenomonadaceae bacterium]|nr:hypothetical protein [Selenomonadaceae bacterium]
MGLIQTRLEVLRERLQMYREAEARILKGVEYQIGDRRLRRPDLATVRKAIAELEEEIASLSGVGRVKRAVFIE